MVVYQGNNYQIRVGDLLSVAGVPTTRQVIAGTGMTGGGQLANNVTLSIAQKGVTGPLLEDSGVTPGVYGNATNIPVLTVDSTGRVMAASSIPVQVSGYVPETRQVIAGEGLTGGGALNTNVTLAANLSNDTPLAGDNAGSSGSATNVARGDHKHPAVDLADGDQVDGLLGLMNGGTNKSLVPDAGAIIWCGADGLYVGPVGEAGQVLVSSGTGEYTWGSAVVITPQAANSFFAGPTTGSAADPVFRAMVNADLPDSGATAGTYGSVLAIPIVTVNDKGVVTSITETSFTGGLSYKGAWNASTNTPTLVSSTGTNGDYYVVSVAGTTNLNGITDWQVGDWALFNGTVWQKIDQTNSVTSVNGQQGAVVLNYSDVGAPSVSGTNATGTWAIGISGNAATATSATSATTATTATTADKVAHALTIGSGLSGTSFDGSAAVTITNSLPMVYPGAGIPNSTGSAWDTSYSTSGSGTVVALATGATLNNPTISNYESWTPATAPSYQEGRQWYDSSRHSLAYYNDSANAVVHIGQDLQVKVINNTGSTIPNGSPVYITSTSSGQTYPNVALAKADVAATSAVIGLTNGAIANGAIGYVTSQGSIDSVNTSSFTVGQVLYLSPYSAGQLMNTIPPTGITVQVGVVEYVNNPNGTIYVKQTTPLAVPASIITGTLGVANGGTGATTLTGYVKGSGTSAFTANSTIPTTDLSGTVTNAQLANSAITINGTSTSLGGSISVGTVTSVAATAGTGISVSGSPITGSGTLTITNTAPDQTVALTSGTGISVTGTYPNFTVTNTAPSSGGTVTSVSGTGTVSGISLSGTVTTSGSLTLGGTLAVTPSNFSSQTANTFLAAPNGSAGTPTFRAIVAADVPTLNQNTTGTAAGLSATLAIASGGTGQTTASAAFNALSPVTTAGDLILGNGVNSSTRLAIGSNATVLTSNGTTASWTALPANVSSFSAGTTGLTPNTATTGAVTLAGTLNVANGGTGLTSLTANYIPYGNGTGAYASSSSLTYNSTTGSLAAPVHNSTNGLIVNSMTVSANYTVATGDSAMSVGPITVASGVSVTVSSGSRWVVI